MNIHSKVCIVQAIIYLERKIILLNITTKSNSGIVYQTVEINP